MALIRQYKLTFTQETIDDETGAVVKEKPTAIAQVCEPDEKFKYMLVPDFVVSQTALLKLYECLKSELEQPNYTWTARPPEKPSNNEDVEDSSFEPTIIPLWPNQTNNE